jgi:hypothetical protein
MREIGCALTRALDVRLSCAGKVVDRARQRLNLARIRGAQAFGRVEPEGRHLPLQACQRFQSELDLDPGRTGKCHPDEDEKQGKRLPELGAGGIQLLLVKCELHEGFVHDALWLDDPIQKEKLSSERPVDEMGAPIEGVRFG